MQSRALEIIDRCFFAASHDWVLNCTQGNPEGLWGAFAAANFGFLCGPLRDPARRRLGLVRARPERSCPAAAAAAELRHRAARARSGGHRPARARRPPRARET